MQQELFNNQTPNGFKAIGKPNYDINTGNICFQCDYRSNCNAIEYPCMSYSRIDGESVIFKYDLTNKTK